MASDLNDQVEEHRRRVGRSALLLEQAHGAVHDLTEMERVSALPEVDRQLKHARGELKRARRTHAALQKEYARFRLLQGIGHDPAFLEDEFLTQELLRLSNRRFIRGDAPSSYEGRISSTLLRDALLAEKPLDQLIENERASRKAGVLSGILDDHASTKVILRQWSAFVQSDEYVSGILARSQDALERFDGALQAFLSGLDSLRITYELQKRRVDRVAVMCEDGRASLIAANDWENVEETCGDEAAAMLQHFETLDGAREEIQSMREELNEELRAFMSIMVPLYLGYVTRKAVPKGEGRPISLLGARRLCRYLVDEVDRTDFVLPGGGGMEVQLPRVPENIEPFRKCASYRRYRKAQQDEATEQPAVDENSDA
jgi:hypothetical protein